MTMTADALLRLRPRDAVALFPGGESEIARQFRFLALVWHPDRSPHPQAAAVMRKLVILRRIAVDRLHGRSSARPHAFELADGSQQSVPVYRSHDFEAGLIHIGPASVVYEISDAGHGLVRAARGFSPVFADGGMRREMLRFLPEQTGEVAARSGYLFVYKRRPELILMRDLIDACPVVDPRHVAWMITRMLNIVAWFDYAGLSHGNIGPNTLLVSPRDHHLALTGPGLFTTAFGRRPTALPVRTLDIAMPMAGPAACADVGIDLELVRLTARELLGDPAGSRLLRDPAVPQPLALWLTTPPQASAAEDFAGWERARALAFGPRKFIAWDLDPADIYEL